MVAVMFVERLFVVSLELRFGGKAITGTAFELFTGVAGMVRRHPGRNTRITAAKQTPMTNGTSPFVLIRDLEERLFMFVSGIKARQSPGKTGI